MKHPSTRSISIAALALAGCVHLPGFERTASGRPPARPAASDSSERSTGDARPDVRSPPIENDGRTRTPVAAPEPTCTGLEDRRTDVDFDDIFRDGGGRYPNVRARRHALVIEANRDEFVAATSDVTENDMGGGYYHAKDPVTLIKKGEPLLRLACSTRYSTHTVMTMSLDYVRDVPAKFIDPAPTTFVLPQAPSLWAFDPHLAYVAASPEDLKAVPGSVESSKLEDQCKAKATVACEAAEEKVNAGPWRPDIGERAERACRLVLTRVRDACMGGAAGKRYERNAKLLDDRRRNRELADFKEVVAKLAQR